MAQWFDSTRDLEESLRPYTGALVLPGQRLRLKTSSRLLFDLYWQLLAIGYTCEQVAGHALAKRWESRPPLQEDLAFALAVFDLARHKNLVPSDCFP